ncbi:MAG: hypothetical protein JXA57_11615, partial [Armatimonadetes bacterium]|nr:hypothetical protein [Armatimonadota bacterium]
GGKQFIVVDRQAPPRLLEEHTRNKSVVPGIDTRVKRLPLSQAQKDVVRKRALQNLMCHDHDDPMKLWLEDADRINTNARARRVAFSFEP